MRIFSLFLLGCGGASSGGDENVCTRSLHHTQECLGDPPTEAVPDDQCVGEAACVSACYEVASCPSMTGGQAADPVGFQRMLDCALACVDPGDSGAIPTLPTEPPPTVDTGTTTSGNTEPEPPTGTTAPRPECTAFASVYCGCLGEFASDTCLVDMADQCDWIYELDPSFYDCVTARQCSGDWLEDCTT